MNNSSVRKKLDIFNPASVHISRWLLAARAVWIILMCVLLALVAYSIATRSTWVPASLPDSEAEILQRAGVAPSTYGIFLGSLELIVALAYTLAAAVIFWSKRDDGMALLVSSALITFGVTVFPFISNPALQWVVRPIQVFGIAAASLTIFLFPNGRFIPSWTRRLTFGLGIWLAALLIFPEVTSAIDFLNAWNPVQLLVRFTAWMLATDVTPAMFAQALGLLQTIGLVSMLIGDFGAGVAAQVYRYRNFSDPVEKQQTKLVVFGLVIALAASLFYYLLPMVFAPLREPGAARLVYQTVSQAVYAVSLVLVPIFLMIAVLRYRLWDVDILINRTIVYTLLTVLLGGLYVGSIFIFQALVRAISGQGSDLVIVVSTLAIAALFRPLRDRLQNFIDRRFYRERVDFRQAFSDFGQELRTLIDLPELERTLMVRVAELLHISYGAVFLRRPEDRFELGYAYKIPPEQYPVLPEKSDVVRRLQTGGIVYRPTASPFSLLIPLIVPGGMRGGLVGILALGPRLSGDQYTRENQSLLLGLANQAGTSIRVAELIQEKQEESKRREASERQLAEHRDSPLGRAEAAAEQLLAHPDRAFSEIHGLFQRAVDDPDSATLAANLSMTLEHSKAPELARLAEGFNYLLAGQTHPETLPLGLRTINRQLQFLADSGKPPEGAAAALAVYSAEETALSARTVTDIAGWTAAGIAAGAEGKPPAGLAADFGELSATAESLRAYERVDTAQDKLAYLAAAIERLGRLHRSVRSQPGSIDRTLMLHIIEHWMAVASGAMSELQSRAQIVCELITRHAWQKDSVTLAFSLRNAGRGAAIGLEVRPLPSAEYEILDATAAVGHLGPGEESLVELRIQPRLPRELRHFRVLVEIHYTDPRGPDQCERFADAVQLLEPVAEFHRIANSYVVGIPLQAGSPLFFGRGDVMAFLQEQLTEGQRNNLVLIGQRRTGKSSLLKQLPLHLGEGFLPVYLDGQSLGLDPGMAAFLHSMASEISRAMEERGFVFPPPAPASRGPALAEFSENPASFFERNFLPAVRRSLGKRPLLLMLDEFEELESAVRRGTLDAAAFPFLRHLIQHTENLSVIFCGTHRVEELASDYWNVLFNISLYRHIGFLSREDSMRLIQEPVAAGGMLYDDLALEKIWRVTAGHPYFLQLICHSLVQRHNRLRRNYVTIADVNASLDEILTTGEAHFVYLWMESTPVQKRILYSISQSGGAGSFTPVQAADDLARRGAAVDRAELYEAFRKLAARDIFIVAQQPDSPFGETYRWKLGLLGMWVGKSKSLGQILEEEKNRG